jgi:hypothetical protein
LILIIKGGMTTAGMPNKADHHPACAGADEGWVLSGRNPTSEKTMPFSSALGPKAKGILPK